MICEAVCALSLAAIEPCGRGLAIGLDVSASVDNTEWRLQRDGTAAGILSQEFIDGATGLSVVIFEFGDEQRIIVPLTRLETREDHEMVAYALRNAPRSKAGQLTGVGSAMLFGAKALEGCSDRVVDISGDDPNNTGIRPERARELIGWSAIVNGLPIGPKASAHYEENVKHGPGSFVEVATGFADFARAMLRKLVREINVSEAE